MRVPGRYALCACGDLFGVGPLIGWLEDRMGATSLECNRVGSLLMSLPDSSNAVTAAAEPPV